MCDNCKTNQKSNNFDISSIILAIQKVVIEQVHVFNTKIKKIHQN